MLTPTVGRDVHFFKFNRGNSAHQGPLAATIANVHGDRLVNLMVIDESGNTFPAINVTLCQEGDELPSASSYCKWPAGVAEGQRQLAESERYR